MPVHLWVSSSAALTHRHVVTVTQECGTSPHLTFTVPRDAIAHSRGFLRAQWCVVLAQRGLRAEIRVATSVCERACVFVRWTLDKGCEFLNQRRWFRGKEVCGNVMKLPVKTTNKWQWGWGGEDDGKHPAHECTCVCGRPCLLDSVGGMCISKLLFPVAKHLHAAPAITVFAHMMEQETKKKINTIHKPFYYHLHYITPLTLHSRVSVCTRAHVGVCIRVDGNLFAFDPLAYPSPCTPLATHQIRQVDCQRSPPAKTTNRADYQLIQIRAGNMPLTFSQHFL